MEKSREKGHSSDKSSGNGSKTGSRESDVKKKAGLGEDEGLDTDQRNSGGKTGAGGDKSSKR